MAPNDVSLLAHLKALINERDRQYGQRFDAQEKAVVAALAAVKEAVLKAEAAANHRFDGVNEFRQTLADQQITFARKGEIEIQIATLEKKLDDLADIVSTRIDRSGGINVAWGWLAGAAGLIGLAITWLSQ